VERVLSLNLVFVQILICIVGTFAKLLAPHYGATILSTGDLVRNEIKKGSELGKQIKHLNDSGKLVSDDLITSMLRNALETLPNDQRIRSNAGKGGFILDGFPRTVPQAQQLSTFQQLDIVLNITLPEEVLVTKAISRRVCSNSACGKGYNIAHIKLGEIDMPPLLPKKEGVCDKVGSEFQV
jgi:adenylate kinase